MNNVERERYRTAGLWILVAVFLELLIVGFILGITLDAQTKEAVGPVLIAVLVMQFVMGIVLFVIVGGG